MRNPRTPSKNTPKVHSFLDAQTRQRREERRQRIAQMLQVPLDHPEVTRRIEEWAIYDHPLAVINSEISAKWLRGIAALLDEDDPRFRFVTHEARQTRSNRRAEEAHATADLKERDKERAGAGRKVAAAKRYLLEAAEVMWPTRKHKKK